MSLKQVDGEDEKETSNVGAADEYVGECDLAGDLLEVDLQLALLGKRLAARRITVQVTDAARAWLAETGYDPAYGARPLRRLIQTAIGDPLARMLIGGQVADGGAVTVDLADGQLALSAL